MDIDVCNVDSRRVLNSDGTDAFIEILLSKVIARVKHDAIERNKKGYREMCERMTQ